MSFILIFTLFAGIQKQIQYFKLVFVEVQIKEEQPLAYIRRHTETGLTPLDLTVAILLNHKRQLNPTYA